MKARKILKRLPQIFNVGDTVVCKDSDPQGVRAGHQNIIWKINKEHDKFQFKVCSADCWHKKEYFKKIK